MYLFFRVTITISFLNLLIFLLLFDFFFISFLVPSQFIHVLYVSEAWARFFVSFRSIAACFTKIVRNFRLSCDPISLQIDEHNYNMAYVRSF